MSLIARPPRRLVERRARDAVLAALHGGPLGVGPLVALARDLRRGLSRADAMGAISELEARGLVARHFHWPEGGESIASRYELAGVGIGHAPGTDTEDRSC